MNDKQLENAIRQALAAPAAPAELVEKVLARTTRRPSLWARYKMIWAGGLAAFLLAVGVGISYFHTTPAQHTGLIAYMSQTQQDEYAVFLSDLDLFEREF